VAIETDFVLTVGEGTPQTFVAVTVTSTLIVQQLTVIPEVPCPLIMVHPAGTVQLKIVPDEFVTLNTTPVLFLHTEDGPEIAEGAGGTEDKVIQLEALLLLQILRADTQTFPPLKFGGTLRLIAFVLEAPFMEHPVGTAHE